MAKPDPSRHAPEEVDAYLAALAEDVRPCLEHVRAVVRKTAPDATERVSYGVIMFRLRKDLVGISAGKGRCSLHVASPPLVRAMTEELKGHEVSGATVHFTPDAPLPEALLVTIVRARMRENGAV